FVSQLKAAGLLVKFEPIWPPDFTSFGCQATWRYIVVAFFPGNTWVYVATDGASQIGRGLCVILWIHGREHVMETRRDGEFIMARPEKSESKLSQSKAAASRRTPNSLLQRWRVTRRDHESEYRIAASESEFEVVGRRPPRRRLNRAVIVTNN